MAFKANAKKPVTKKSTSTAPVETIPEKVPEIKTEVIAEKVDLTAPVLSIEDLVGAPKKSSVKTETTKPLAVEAAAIDAFVKPTISEVKIEAPINPEPQMSQPQNGGGYRPRGYQPGFRPMRREFNGQQRYNQPPRQYPENNNNFTQDINVPTETVHGILDIMPEGHGFLRPKFTPSERDVYISQSQIRRFLLRNGDMVEGQARPPKENERYWGLLKVEKIDEQLAEGMVARPKFEDLTPIYPIFHLKVETDAKTLSTRMIDLIAPIGFGQRGLIVSPPKAGKTTILKELAAGISANYPKVHLMAALIGERPEEVTDITRSVHGEVLASNFDESPSEQTRIAEVALDRAKRLVEMGKDVVILLDSITRLARAYNLVVNPSGRTLSGGFDPAALYPAKKFLGAARCVEPVEARPVAVVPGAPAVEVAAVITEPNEKRYTTGGSLTVIGTALVDTGSRMDDLIYEEFKGTGNMELTLSRQLQERRVFPAIDIEKSGTRHDELLLGEDQMKKVTTLRHMLSLLSAEERTMMMIERLSKSTTNAEFLESLSKG
jgi:transcription termination factor Rho